MSSNFGKTLGIFLTIIDRADIPDDHDYDHDDDHNQWYPTSTGTYWLFVAMMLMKLNKDLPPLVLEVMSAP